MLFRSLAIEPEFQLLGRISTIELKLSNNGEKEINGERGKIDISFHNRFGYNYHLYIGDPESERITRKGSTDSLIESRAANSVPHGF